MEETLSAWLRASGERDFLLVIGGRKSGVHDGKGKHRPLDYQIDGLTVIIQFDDSEQLTISKATEITMHPNGELVVKDASEVRFTWYSHNDPAVAHKLCEEVFRKVGKFIDFSRTGTSFIELLNEPNGELNAALWNEYSGEALAIVRESNPTRDVIVGPVSWNAYDWVSTLDVPGDEHIIVTFHYYLPFEFTHQGAAWVEESDPWLGQTWEATDSEKAEITRHFDAVAEWAQQQNVPVLLGEFGAYSKAEMDSRVRWTEFVRSEAERRGFAWAYWEFASDFGVYDPEAKVWKEDLLKVLIP